MSKKYQGVNVVKVDVATSDEVESVDHSATGGYVGVLRFTKTTMIARDNSGRAIASESFRGSHPMTQDNYRKKLQSRIQNGGGAWFGETLDQLHARLDAEMDAAYLAGGEVLRAYKDRRLARIEAENRQESHRVDLGLSMHGIASVRSK